MELWRRKNGNKEPLPASQTTAIEFRIIPFLFFSYFAKKKTHTELTDTYRFWCFHLAMLRWKKERNPSEVNSHVKYLFIWLFEWQKRIKGGSDGSKEFHSGELWELFHFSRWPETSIDVYSPGEIRDSPIVKLGCGRFLTAKFFREIKETWCCFLIEASQKVREIAILKSISTQVNLVPGGNRKGSVTEIVTG